MHSLAELVKYICKHARSTWKLLRCAPEIPESDTPGGQPATVTDSSMPSLDSALEDRVDLSWASVTDNSPIPIQVATDKSNAHYRLYNDCLQYLEAKFPGGSFPCSISMDIIRQPGLAHLHPSFGTLVNLLADKYPARLVAQIPLETLKLTFQDDSVLDFIFSGMLVTVTYTDHVACALRESPRSTTTPDLYQALFLDCVTTLWSHECWKRANTTQWSPMPWSRVSSQELFASQALATTELTFQTPTLSMNNLADEDSSGVHTARALIGSPTDIPWFGAPHDGYAFCNTLSGYTRARRQSAIQSLRDDAALWVGAMTLGVLEAVMRSRIPESLLIVPGTRNGEKILSGDRILRLLSSWHDMLLNDCIHENADARTQHGRDVARLLDQALHALDEEFVQHASVFLRAGYLPEDCTDIVGAVALTIAPLCSVAYRAWRELPEMTRLTESAHDHIRNFYTAAQAYCRRKMRGAGWCPNTISHSFMSSLWGVPIISNLIRLPPYIRKSPDEHKDCSEAACVFYTIVNTDEYVQRHVNPACRCPNIRPSLDDVANILCSGLVPTVIFDGDVLRVLPADDGAYVAISHVWADGMGSTTDNGLPTCVVKRVSGLAQQLLPESGAFWMDSLCVPASGALRKRAIKLMAHTYRRATKVLVVDECIRVQCSTESKSWEENLFRIATSGWVRRVWTLQEGLLARELYFEFREGPVDVEAGLGLKPSKPSSTPGNAPSTDQSLKFRPTYSCDSHAPVLAFRAKNYANIEAGHNVPLDEVIKLLRLRTTTKAEDELVAISSLLSFDVDTILAITGPDAAQQRMKAFLLQQGELPREFPMHVSPRLTLPSFTWAPFSLTTETEGANLSSGTGICTTDGLAAEYFVAAFQNSLHIPDEYTGAQGRSVFNTLINHNSSMGTYALRLHVLEGNTSTRPIDALLFLEGDLLSARSPIPCAAVCSTDGPESINADIAGPSTKPSRSLAGPGGQELYTKLSYVAPGRLHRTAVPSDVVVNAMPIMGGLCKTLVQLA
ncbi:hypothetical protein BC628DRAFT_1500779 [Trametes gibbosa]|nr:hypothetical protein BC628DRAFT_1500779 [Trametes gibbosa]